MVYRTIKPLQILMHKVLGLAQAGFDSSATDNEREKTEKRKSTQMLTEFSQGLPVKRTDEVGELARAFSRMGQALETNIENLLHTQAITQRVQGELNAARKIQLGILKDFTDISSEKHFDIWVFLDPAKEVGGDLYEYFTLQNGKKVIVIGDVSGKGVPAALFMSMTVTLIRYAMQAGMHPADAMCKINETLSQNNPSCMFVTLFIGVLDTEKGELVYSNGGHCYPYIVNRKNEIVRIAEKNSGPMVGVLEGVPYEGYSIAAGKNDTVLLYTDGVTEAMNEENVLYGEEHLQKLLLTNKNQDAESIIRAVYQDILLFRGKAEQSDDITMLCFCCESNTE